MELAVLGLVLVVAMATVDLPHAEARLRAPVRVRGTGEARNGQRRHRQG
jgi:hypothetical protein